MLPAGFSLQWFNVPLSDSAVSTPDMPVGLYIIVNDVAERFSFYGLRAILVIFMTLYLMSSDGQLATLPDEDATSYFHLFTATAYFLPLLGAIIADAFWGKYKTIISLSLVYCAGHFSLFLDDTQIGLFLGLTLVAVGSGGIVLRGLKCRRPVWQDQ